MKNAPCARFGIRIRPKISEKPDDNRNSRPPKATLFSVWMIQNCHCIDDPLSPNSHVQFFARDSEIARRRKSSGGPGRVPAEAERRRVGEGAEASPAKRASPPPGAFRA